ncbi:serine hydrolase [Micromonospora cathayae]|uniref:Serine hydrolase n=1 Tax=Micromonospora cathayae TaxID=3028804 RepID=A0ABY7ZW80_9ACTN|nr:serine hydrolase [Micromonospora sp. HUAS 3]WDZ87250.1 serine hydrolase [Micromonospora sp. HUAS 3]
MTMRRRVAVVLATVLAGAALSGPPALAVPGVPSPIFDPDSVSWLSLRDQTSAQFATSFATHSKSYLIDDLDIDTTGGAYRVGSVWQQNTDKRGWKELRDLDDAGFHAAWVEASNQGMRLTEQETYLVGGARRYAGVWVENVENLSWTSFRGLTSAEFSTKFDEQRRAGRMPIDIDVYDTSQGLRYSVIWVQNAENLAWALWRDLTSAEFSTKFAELQRDYRMLTFESVRTTAGQRYAGIWVENRNGRGWVERRDMTAAGFANYWHRYSDEGYRLVAYNKYDTAGGVRYAGIWRQNNDRPDWALKTAVNTRIQAELDSTAVPGVSVAVFHNNQAKYLRGFGFADIDDNVWMDSGHVGSIASVSKAVGGVLTMRMVEQGLVDLDDASRDLVPSMPAHHTHTVGDLLSSRGCVGHYGDIDTSGFDNVPYATALAAADEFWDEPLVCAPPDYHYSTPGYTLLGAGLEAAGGDNIKNLVRTKLTTPYGLGTLAPADLSAGVRRMTEYTTSNAEAPLENKDWKTLGGGIQSNVYDLGRFGAKLAAGQILTQASLDTMWTAPDADSNYAYGWNTGVENGHQVVAKDGSWTGALAYLRIYPEDGIVVAVMMNDRSGSQDAAQLGRDIGAMVLNSLP